MNKDRVEIQIQWLMGFLVIASDLLAHASSLGVFVIFNRSELVKDRKPIDWLACMVKD